MAEIFTRKDGKTDYCSFSPDVVFGVDIGRACENHDRFYASQKIPRKLADIVFREDIKGYFYCANKRFIGKIIANIYYFAVRVFGGFRWKK